MHLRAYLIGGDVAATDQSRRLGRPKNGLRSPRQCQSDVRDKVTTNSRESLDDASTRSVTWSLKWVKQRRGDVAATSSQSPWSPAGLGDVTETSPQSLTNLVSTTDEDVAETSPRPCLDWKKSPPKKSNMFEFPATPRSLQETSQRRLRNQRRLELPPGRHLVSRLMR